MAYTQDQINAALVSSQRRWSFRHEILVPNGDLKNLANITEMSVENDDNADNIKRTGSLTISYDSGFDFWNDRLRSYCRLLMPDGGWQEWCVGTFYLTTTNKKWRMAVNSSQQKTYTQVAENLSPNPSVEADSTGWGTANGATLTRSTSAGINSEYGVHYDVPANGTADAGGNVPLGSLTSGVVYTAAVYVRAVNALTFNTYTNGAATDGSIPRTQLTLAAGEVGRLIRTFTASSTGNGGWWILRSNGSAVDSFDVDGVVCVEGAVPPDYFDGSYGEGQDYRYRWTGTSSNSTSIKEKIAYSVSKSSAMSVQGISSDAYDLTQALVEDAYLDRHVITSGTNYRDAIVSVLNSSGFNTTSIASTDLTLPADREWEPGTSKYQIVSDLLTAINYRTLFMDPYGVPTSYPYQAPEDAAPIWTYKCDKSSVILPDVDDELDIYNIPNAWVATVSEPDLPVLTSSKINDDPASPLSTVNRGRTIVQIVSTDSLNNTDGTVQAPTQAVLDALVQKVAEESSRVYSTASFETGIMPFHGSGDVFTLDYGEGANKYRETNWTMELKAGGVMNHTFVRAVTLS